MAATVIEIPAVRITFRYVLILELLNEDDAPTGAMLHEHLQAAGLPSRLTVCRSAEDVHAAIEDAQARVGADGIPAIHIETHGAEPSDDPTVETIFGNDEIGIEWREFGAWLAPLNRRCDFELLVVAASCYGAAANSAMGRYEHSAAFAGCIGYRTSVYPEPLLETMRGMYSAIIEGEDIRVALAAAKQAAGDDTQIELRLGLTVCYDILRLLREEYGDPAVVARRFRRKLAGKPIAAGFWERLPSFLAERRRYRSEEAWAVWFPPELIARQPNYRLDWSIVDA